MTEASKGGFQRGKVELHVHLDGAIRPRTVWDQAQKRGLPTPGNTYEEFYQHLKNLEPSNLPKILETFVTFLKPVIGDREGLKKIAYELCEFQAQNGIVYFEARYSPHFLANCDVALEWGQEAGDVRVRDVIRCINEGLQEGCEKFGVKAKSILCCIRHRPEWSAEVLSLCREFQDSGVVGMDIAGYEIVPSDPLHIQAFQEAARCGVHRTAHAGESTSAASVVEAVDQMRVERIGHGCTVLEDDSLYQRIRQMDTHFEVSLVSNYYTGACKDYSSHHARRFAADDVNFSLNTDDPGVFLTTIHDEFDIARNKVGLSEEQLIKTTFNAARSSFLPEGEKKELIDQLKKSYQISD
ncbi:adenosine deaminase-like [Glandiceps talaboti]